MSELLVIQSGLGESAWNMAVDEALLLSMPRLQTPVLRFYGWREPAATFGYFQKYSEVEKLTALRPLIRRPTGGGIVPHDADWTYSIAFPASHEWYGLKAVESYRRVHAWLQAGFAILRVQTQLAPCCSKAGPGQCFVGYEQHDLLWRGRKIAGAAQRRTRDGLLIQGSVQPPTRHAVRSDWERAVEEAGRSTWHFIPREWNPDSITLETAEKLSRGKYGKDAFNRKR